MGTIPLYTRSISAVGMMLSISGTVHPSSFVLQPTCDFWRNNFGSNVKLEGLFSVLRVKQISES